MIAQEIQKAFQRWCRSRLFKSYELGGFGFGSLQEKNPSRHDRNSISSFLGPEADIQMHFGAYLFEHLASLEGEDRPLKYSVHSEMKIYEQKSWRADLIVTRVSGATRFKEQELRDSVVAVIEIKGQTYFNPTNQADFFKMIDVDSEKLKALHPNIASKDVAKFMLIYFERPQEAIEFKAMYNMSAKACGIELLIPINE